MTDHDDADDERDIEIRRRPRDIAERAIFGIIMGVIGTVLLLVYLVAIIVAWVNGDLR